MLENFLCGARYRSLFFCEEFQQFPLPAPTWRTTAPGMQQVTMMTTVICRFLPPQWDACIAICSTDWFSWRVSLSQFKGPSVLERQRVLNAIWTFLLRLPSWQQGGKVRSDRLSARALSSSSTDFYEVERKQQRNRSAEAAEFDKWAWKCHPCRGGGSHRWLNNLQVVLLFILTLSFFLWLDTLPPSQFELSSQYSLCTPLDFGGVGPGMIPTNPKS